jgi:hypothetical protein
MKNALRAVEKSISRHQGKVERESTRKVDNSEAVWCRYDRQLAEMGFEPGAGDPCWSWLRSTTEDGEHLFSCTVFLNPDDDSHPTSWHCAVGIYSPDEDNPTEWVSEIGDDGVLYFQFRHASFSTPVEAARWAIEEVQSGLENLLKAFLNVVVHRGPPEED